MNFNLPKISVLISAYLEESKPYLDICIAAIRNLNYPQDLLDILIVSPEWYQPQYPGVKTMCPCPGEYHNPVALNFSIENSDQTSKFAMMMNDDVFMTKNSLIKLVHMAGDNRVILGGMSPCDNNEFFNTEFPMGLNNRQYRLEDVRDKIPAMLDADLPPSHIKLIRPHTLYLFANLYPRELLRTIKGGTTPESVGFDENLKTGYDDTDFCLRARKDNVALGIVADALIWHMSGVSADKTMGDLKSDIRKENVAIFNKKYGF